MSKLNKLKMNYDRVIERNAEELGKGMKALAGKKVMESDEAAEEPVRKGPRNTAVSFSQEEYEFIKTVFETKAKGMKTATGIKMAALYVAERLDAGFISMSRAGIIERR